MSGDRSRVNVGIITLNLDENIDRFIITLGEGRNLNVCASELESTDLANYEPPELWKAVILIHSVKLGRLSLTDVADARYDRLMKTLSEKYETRMICVIAHDVRNCTDSLRNLQLSTLKKTQPSVFKHTSGNVIICGTLDEFHPEDVNKLNNFLDNVDPTQRNQLQNKEVSAHTIRFQGREESANGSSGNEQDVHTNPKILAKPSNRNPQRSNIERAEPVGYQAGHSHKRELRDGDKNTQSQHHSPSQPQESTRTQLNIKKTDVEIKKFEPEKEKLEIEKEKKEVEKKELKLEKESFDLEKGKCKLNKDKDTFKLHKERFEVEKEKFKQDIEIFDLEKKRFKLEKEIFKLKKETYELEKGKTKTVRTIYLIDASGVSKI